jgi:probable HAF family extracellular repeat protein
VLSLSVLVSTLVAAQDASYTFTTFAVPNALRTEAYGINDVGQIVWRYQDDSLVTHGFLYIDGIFTSLDVLGARATSAQGINNRGQIVGTTRSRMDGSVANFVWRCGTPGRCDH